MLITITACAGTNPHSDDDAAPAVQAAYRPPQAFLTVTAGMFKIARIQRLAEWIARYPVGTLQLRSVRHSRVIRTLLRSLGQIDAVSADDGTVIAAADFGCRSQLFRIDPATGKRALIRVVPQAVENIALSPDGSRLAYITDPPSQPQPCGRMHQPRHPVKAFVNPPGILPSIPAYEVLAIVNLTSGATLRARIPHAVDPTWSPDGTQIAVADIWDNVTHVLSATTLNGLATHKFVPLCRFAYTGTMWTRSGLAVAMRCNIEYGRNRPFVELVPLTGKAGRRRLTLPRCTSGVTVSYAGEIGLFWAGLGYGGGKPCGVPVAGGYAVAIMLLNGASFARAATIPRQPGDFTFAGW